MKNIWSVNPSVIRKLNNFVEAWGSVVVKALRYYSEGLGIDPQ
jgi:hypothetical protein